jgi:hypothetical protein
MAIGFQTLCEIAERELNAGVADPKLVERALAEAKGVEVHARQIYWHVRAKQLQQIQSSGGDASIREVLAIVEGQEGRLRRWFWALACVVGMLGAAGFPFLAFRAAGREGPAFLVFGVLSAASLALATYAYIACRYHTHTEAHSG